MPRATSLATADAPPRAPTADPLRAFASLPVERLMSRRVISVGMDDSLELIRRLLQKHDIHHLPVLDAGRLVGVISDRDVLRALSPALGTAAETARDAATLRKRAHQIMSRKLVTVAPGASVAAAVRLLVGRRLSCLPVCESEDRLLGLLSWRDLLRQLDSDFNAPPD